MSCVEIKASVCPLDCPDTCSLSVSVEAGRVVEVRGSDTNPYTSGTVCKKVTRYYPHFVHGEGRLTHPLLRTGPRGSGEYQRIGWAQALDRVHRGFTRAMAEHGPQTVLPLNYAGPHGQLAMASMDRRFFHRLGATLLDRGPLCGAVRGTAYRSLFGDSPGLPPDQVALADLVIVWGNNVTTSNLHLSRMIKAARARGAKLVVVDAKRTKIADRADLFVQPRPGTDVVLALAMAAEFEQRGLVDHSFLEQWATGLDPYLAQARQYTLAQAAAECRLGADVIEHFIALYGSAQQVAMSLGNGLERGRWGGSALRAAMALQVLTGNLGRPGAGITAMPGAIFPKTPERLQRPDLIPHGTRMFNIVDVAGHLLDPELDPPVQVLFIYNHNPLCTHPDQNRLRRALTREDLFIVGSDVVMTDSMSYADIILPAASHFEHGDLYAAYGQHYLQRSEAVIPLQGEALPNTEIFRRLAARFGFTEPLFQASDSELMDDALNPDDARLGGKRPSQLPIDTALPLNTASGEPPLICGTVAPATPSGRVELYSDALESRYGCGVPRYGASTATHPFVLISPSSFERTNSTFGGHPANLGPSTVEMHPTDAAGLEIETGHRVILKNARGEVRLEARVSDAVQPGVLYSAKGTWLATSDNGQTVNALIPADLKTDIADGACYHETFVDVQRI